MDRRILRKTLLACILSVFLFVPNAMGQTTEHAIFLPVVNNNYSHLISFTYIPACHSFGEHNGFVQGRVWLEEYTPYYVSVYVFADEGWWFKAGLINIIWDGYWEAPVITEGRDLTATRFAAFLIPWGIEPIGDVQGDPELPASLFQEAISYEIADRSCTDQPGIAIITVPTCRTEETLKGMVWNVDPSAYHVAVYIYVDGGWWTKPTWGAPLTYINADSTWETYVVTGGNDVMASKYAAFLLRYDIGIEPDELGKGQAEIPKTVFEKAITYTMEERNCYRTINWSGYDWWVKASVSPIGPGPNFFSDDPKDVFVDEQGRLHLTIVPKEYGNWWCSEVINTEALGYGTYIFRLASRIDQLDPNVVLGLFTYDISEPAYHNREIDIEFSRWGDINNDNSQFVVQPFDEPENMYRFNTILTDTLSTHGFDWQPGQIFFQSLQGNQPFPGLDPIAEWTYTGNDIPPEGNETARFNLWLINGVPPQDNKPVEVIIEDFEFLPGN